MISYTESEKLKDKAAELIRESGISFTQEEKMKMDTADFGLSNILSEGAEIMTLALTDKIAFRVVALIDGQTEPEHWHVSVNGYSGKEETIRVVKGILRVCTEGDDNLEKECIPVGKEKYYTCRHERILHRDEVITFQAGQKHWFQAVNGSCVVYCISTTAHDNLDPFSDPNIVRKTIIFGR